MSDQVGDTCLRCNAPMTDEEYFRQNVAICDKCRPVYFQLPNVKLTAYVDERTADGQEIIELLQKNNLPFSVIPMSGIPEVVQGLARHVGVEEIRRLVVLLAQEATVVSPGKLSEEEKATLIQGGFDLTEHRVLDARQIGPLFLRFWDNGTLSLRFTWPGCKVDHKPEHFLSSDDRQKLIEWLGASRVWSEWICNCGSFDGKPHMPKAGCL